MYLPTAEELKLPAFYEIVDREGYPEKDQQYVRQSVQYCYSAHSMVTQPVLMRTANSLIGGRILAQKLAALTPLTLDILTGEMGGAPPLPKEHPLKGAAVAATTQLLHIGWGLARWVASTDCTATLDARVIKERKLPGFIPTAIQFETPEGVVYRCRPPTTQLIYILAGGQFTVPAGMAFSYHCVPEETDSGEPLVTNGAPSITRLTAEVYFDSIPAEARDTQIAGLRQLITDRNQIFEELIEHRLSGWIKGLATQLERDGLLGPEVTEAAKAYAEAHADAEPETVHA